MANRSRKLAWASIPTCALWMSFGMAFGQAPATTAPARMDSVMAITGETYKGKASFDLGALMVSAEGGTPAKVEYNAILRADLAEKGFDDEVIPPGLVLVDGTRVAGAFGNIAEPTVKFPKHNLTVAGQEVSWVVYEPFSPATAEKLPTGKTGALLPGGDFFEGTIRSADSDSAKVMSLIFGARLFHPKEKEILALVARDVKPSAAPMQVLLTDGCLFNVDAISADHGVVSMHAAALGLVKVEAKEIAGIRAGAARSAPLWSIKPARVNAPQGLLGPEYTVNKSLEGRPISVWGAPVAHGIDAPVGVALTWDVPAGFSTVVAQIALPAGSDSDAKLSFAIYTDGRLASRSLPIAPTDRPAAIHAALNGARTVSLRVEPPVNGGHATGEGIWIEPTLIRR